MPRYIKTFEPIDDFLASQGLVRKITAKDGSCLFRAVAEQVFHTQALHNDVRQACIRFMERNKEHFEPFVEGPFEQHLDKLQTAKEWAGQVEISALSLMYKRDFIIYQDPGKPPSNVTQNGYPNKVLLCFSNNNHYDSVFTKQYQNSLGVCQSIVYEILYKRVFNIAKEADEAVEVLRNSPGKKPHSRHYGYSDHGPNAGGDSLNQRSPRRHEDEERDRFGRLRIEKRRPPLPYKVAKALDPDMYRNVEYDCWNAGNKEQVHQDYLLATGLQFCPGDKVQVVIDDSKKWYSAHIQEVKPDKGPITVFVEDLGEKYEIPVKNVKPHPSNPPRSWTVVGPRGSFKDFRPRSKPPVKWGSRGQSVMVLTQSFPPGGEPMGEGQNIPFQMRGQQNGSHKGPKSPSSYRSTTPPPRFMNRGIEGHLEQIGRGRAPGYQGAHMMQDNRGSRGRMCNPGMQGGGYPYDGDTCISSEEMEDRKSFEENLAIYEAQDPTMFPPLHSNCGLQGGPGNNPAQFWSKMRKDGRRSISPQQRLDSPSPHMTDKRGSDPMDAMLPGQFQDIMLSSQDQRGLDAGCMDQRYSPITTITDDGMIHPSTSPSIPKSATPSSLSVSPSLDPQSGSPPTIAPAGYVPPMAMGLPFYHFFISLTDWNISGNVNFNTQISRDPNGSDLPLSDISTSRFFFNLGVEYYRRVCMIQQLQHQQCYQFPASGHFPQQQQPPQHGTSPAYTHVMPHATGVGMVGPPMGGGGGKAVYDVGGGVAVLTSGGCGAGGASSGGAGGQEDEDQQDGQVGYEAHGGQGRNFNQSYMSEPIPINSTAISQPNSTVYGNMCNVGGETYVPVAYQSQGMPQQSPVPANQMGVASTTQNPYMYSHPVTPPMGYTGGKMLPHPNPQAAYSPNNPVTYVQMASPAVSHQQQHHPPHQQQTCLAMQNNQGNVVAASSSGQYSTHSTSVVSNSSCSSQDSGILSCSPPQVPYAASGQ
ncbi:OTU domain-containing protein 4-like isoform X2 [Lytechinus variegatus]|uniref:OTU domain-containing protein 4-like isoform X2 n=1 Tax=Lytechinus variegatus TaxID=7654 RepID=UPI001BB1307B|nr:OTU domain-containing protein 4-like isoform X2 [Lytechinus variegatus]